jgi:hypothetical protein
MYTIKCHHRRAKFVRNLKHNGIAYIVRGIIVIIHA